MAESIIDDPARRGPIRRGPIRRGVVRKNPVAKRLWIAGGFSMLATAVAGWMLRASLTDPPRHDIRRRTASSALGLTLAAVRVDGRDRLIVTSLGSGSAAMGSGLRVGDAIEDVDEHAVASRRALDAAIARDDGRPVAIEVLRGGRLVRVRLIAPTGGKGVEQSDIGDRGRRYHG